MANKNHHISITRMSMGTRLGRMIASLDGLLPVMLHDPLITWPCEIRVSITEGGSARKCFSCYQLVFDCNCVKEMKCYLHDTERRLVTENVFDQQSQWKF